MSKILQHHTALAIQRGQLVGRRDFLRQVSALGLAAGAVNWTDAISASADELHLRGRACILLWMQGGPSQFETFSPLPHHENGGPTKAISTSVAGIQIAEHMPHCAKVMNQLAIIRSMTSEESNHQRATYLLHHGRLPTGDMQVPNLGANVAQQIGDVAAELPSYVRIGNRLANAGDGGFLGVQYDPLVLRSATRPQMEAFEVSREPQSVKDAYGPGNFASGCLLARRLVEQGTTFVEVVSNGWDTHQDNFKRTASLASRVDRPMAALVADLKSRGILEKTLVVWLGEFGRTPRINVCAGRDHYPRAFNAVLAGGGVQGGQVVGSTNAAGTEVVNRPVTVQDLFRTIYQSLGINTDQENYSRIGQPFKLVDGGAVVGQLLS